MEKEKSRALSFDVTGDKDVMPIMGFYGPSLTYHKKEEYEFPNRITDEWFQMIAEAGIKIIDYSDLDYATHPELVKKSLDLCKKYDMKYWVLDSNISSNMGKVGDEPVDREVLKKELAKFADHPAYGGIFLIDEPRTSYYLPGFGGQKDIARHQEIAHVLQYELGQTCYINLFPLWDMETQGPVYEKYVAEYCETLRPKYLMWDHYPYYPNRECERIPVYFYNMDVARKYAHKYDIPFFAAIQAGSQWNDEMGHFDSELPYFPDEAHFDWNINTCLAFGVQGITYFPLIQPEHFAYAGTEENPAWDFKRNGLIGATGEKNQWWHYAQRINKHIAAIDEVLMNAVNKGVIVTSEQAKEDMKLTTCMISSGCFEELVSVEGDAMIGCFNYNGKTALYVVNYNWKTSQSVALDFDTVHEIALTKKAETLHKNSQRIELCMDAGEGVLIVID